MMTLLGQDASLFWIEWCKINMLYTEREKGSADMRRKSLVS